MIYIATTGGSGSLFMAELLNALGLEIGHEEVCRDGMIGPQYVSDGVWLEGLHGYRTDHKWTHILHQVRHPLKVMGSIRWFRRKHYRYLRQFAPVPTAYRFNESDIRMIYWIYWNRMAEKIAEWTYRVEDVKPGSTVWEKLCGYAFGEHRDMPELKGKGVHHRAKRTYDWKVLKLPWVRKQAQELAVHYGYEI